jgi:amidophosphoribosyltransferase
MFSSESVALDCLNYSKKLRDVEPGESMFIDFNGMVHSHKYREAKAKTPCIFEYVYLARPDSTMDKINVYNSRLSMGKYLAKKIKNTLTSKELREIDVVIPIPDTSRTSALPISVELKKELREGFVKNRYIGRTFIMPGQKIRKKSVKQKLNTINMEFKGRVVLLIDDSIVRGNTSKQIIQMAREAGAKKVIFASASPPIKFPNVYGIDMPYVEELVAYNKTIEEICAAIGADKLIYQDLNDLIKAVYNENKNIKAFDTSCFDGKYITEGVTEEYLNNLYISR